MTEEEITKVPDPHFNLVSTIYHALQAATLYPQYIKDAEEAGDQELVQFFRDAQNAAATTGQKARDLLAARLKS